MGVVGESVTDIEAFKAANVSFSMGSGTSFARNEASLILATDDFASVMQAVMWGRNIYQNIQRFLLFQITVNLSCLVTVLVGYITLTESPLNAVQLIWINLIMDIFGALALASTKPTEDLKSVRVNQERILAPHIYRQLFGVTLYNVAIMIWVTLGSKVVFGIDYENHVQTTDES